MSLFVVKHQHDEGACPAGDPQMAPLLQQHVSPGNVESHGMTLHGEAVIDGQHTLYLILDAPDQDRVENYMQPFTQVGSVDVMPASSCEAVVQRAAC